MFSDWDGMAGRPRTALPHVGQEPGPRCCSEGPLLAMAFASPEPGVLVVQVQGELDLASAPEFDDRVQRATRHGLPRRLIVDLHLLGFLGLQGIAVFERLRRRAVASGVDVSLVGLSPAGTRALEFAGVLPLFVRYPDVASALAETDPHRAMEPMTAV